MQEGWIARMHDTRMRERRMQERKDVGAQMVQGCGGVWIQERKDVGAQVYRSAIFESTEIIG